MTRLSRPDEINTLLSEHFGPRAPLAPHDDLFGRLGAQGDDINDFLDAFEGRFDVDMTSFLWYFHYNADGLPGPRRVLPVLSDGSTPRYQPITLRHLMDAAEEKRWVFDYPAHDLVQSQETISLTFPAYAAVSLVIAVCFALLW